jgi:hypothetical protein
MMMKFASLIALVLLVLVYPVTGGAQNRVTTIQSLKVQLWPDYDRPAVLVMISGSLPSSTLLPAAVNLPLLPGATLNAVARADINGNLFSDIEYTADSGKLSLTTPDPKFRVEYYVPYRVEGGEHRFTFDWLADVSVEELSVIVQKPASATSLVTQPPAAEVVHGKDGFTYHLLPASSAPAREPRSVQFSYAATSAVLSAERRPAPTPASAPAPAPSRASRLPAAPAATAEPGLGWGLLVAVVVTAGASMGITWQIARNRFASSRAAAETPRAEPPAEGHCPGCGRPCGSDDRFCSDCGQELRPQA